MVDKENPLLMPTSNGLFALDSGRWTVLDSRNGLPCNRIFSVVKDRLAPCGFTRSVDWCASKLQSLPSGVRIRRAK